MTTTPPSTRATVTREAGSGPVATLAAGEGIRTEIARKFTAEALATELADHGFERPTVWSDAARDFGLVLVVVV